eukprot:maker-scaffold1115_size61649-snap-gene-0.7 protein:Tk09806 transcript:maker-scaffold1115_size61649-snap-gene-0.7-mRNA-1 annotation:"phospholipid scramblase 1"
MAESAVESVKMLLAKCSDASTNFRIGLDEFRNMLRSGGVSPAEMFFLRSLRGVSNSRTDRYISDQKVDDVPDHIKFSFTTKHAASVMVLGMSLAISVGVLPRRGNVAYPDPAQQYQSSMANPGYQGPEMPNPGYPHQGAPTPYPTQETVIFTQPQMGAPGPPPGVNQAPGGLAYLAQLNQVLIKQQVEVLEAFTGFETCNKYKVQNVMGQPVFFAKEETNCCTRMCCGPIRPFDMSLVDNFGTEVIHIYRPFRCQSCCFPCCLQELEVSSPPGNPIGSVVQNWSVFMPSFTVKDASGNSILKITGPFCTWSCCGDVEFELFDMKGQSVGKISKQWSGIGREAFTDADNFGVSFPLELDVKAKAVLLGAVFLIDFMFFEKSGNNENDGIGMMG